MRSSQNRYYEGTIKKIQFFIIYLFKRIRANGRGFAIETNGANLNYSGFGIHCK